MTYIGQYDSPLGKITLACDGQNLTGLWFDGQKYFGSTITPPVIYADAPPLDAAAQWLDEYFSGRIPSCAPPLKLAGTPFMLKVWAFLRTVPYGKTATYKEIAEAAGSAPRAVGGAVARNPVSLIVPCHRAVGADGSLTGYAGGLSRKEFLLALEKNAAKKNNTPLPPDWQAEGQP